MLGYNMEFWDNFDEVLFEEYKRQKLMYRFKKQQLQKQIMYN